MGIEMRIRQLTLLILFFSAGFFKLAYSQVFEDKGMAFVQNFSTTDYGAESQNWSIVKDKRGVYYFGNTKGILEFDGISWTLIKTANNTLARSMDVSAEGVVFVGANNDFGYLDVKEKGKVSFVSLKQKYQLFSHDFQDVWKVYATSNGVYFLSDNIIFYYADNKISVIKENLAANLAYKVNNTVYIIHAKGGISAMLKDKPVLLPFSLKIKPYEVGRIIMLPYRNNEMMILTNYGGIQLYKLSALNQNYKLKNKNSIEKEVISDFQTPLLPYIRYGLLYEATIYADTLIAMGTNRNGVFLMDYDGNWVDFANKNTGLASNSVYFLFSDNHQLLWVGTEMGVSVIDFDLPLRKYDAHNKLDGAVLTTLKYNGYRYAGTMQNLYYQKKTPLNVKSPSIEYAKVKDVYDDSWQLIKHNNQLMNLSSYGLQLIKDSFGAVSSYFGNAYSAAFRKNEPSVLYVGLIDGLIPVMFKNSKNQEYPQIIPGQKFSAFNDPISHIVSDEQGDLWMSSYYNGVIKAEFDCLYQDSVRFIRYGIEHGLPQNDMNFPVLINKKIRILTPKGVYSFSDYDRNFIHDEEFSIFNQDSMAVSQLIPYNEQIYYYLSEKSAGYIYKENKDWKKNDSIFNLIPINSIHNIYLEDSALWAASNLGLFKIDIRKPYQFRKNFNALFRKIVIGADSVIFAGSFFRRLSDSTVVLINEQSDDNVITIDYNYNSLMFEFASFTGHIYSEPMFQTMLDGYDENPGNPTNEPRKYYTNLWEGTYTFKVRAIDVYGNYSDWISYRFRIKPPIHRSFPFIILYLFMVLGILHLSMKWHSRRLKRANIKLEAIVAQRTAEIDAQKREIDAQKQQLEITNRELEKLSIAVRETDNAILIMDTSGRIEWINEGFVKRYGYLPEEVLAGEKNNINDYTDNRTLPESIAYCIAHKKSVSYEALSRTKYKERLWAQTTLTPILDGQNNVVKIIAIDSDISRLKYAESEIYQQKEEIESQKNMLEELNATKDKFFSIIAHDLRGPIGTVINTTGMMVDNYPLLDEEERKTLLIEVHKASFATYNLLENLLNWSRSQRGELKFNPEKVEMSLIIAEVVELLLVTAKNKEVSIENTVIDEFFVYADENMISLVVRNLINNALKFSRKEGLIKIECQLREAEYIVSVSDSGIGMSEELQGKLFKLGSYISSPGTANEKGSGLGLVLSAEFIERNSGKIWCESKLNEGSIFRFSIPAYQE
jgi:PAS domain S-box-containing protein